MTSYTYDKNGNLLTVTDPNGQTSGKVTTYFYDQQNRVSAMDDRMVNDPSVPHKNALGYTISYTYDQASNKLTERRSNDQVISYAYDSMNHVRQMTVPQTPSPTANSVYDYDATGLMQVMHDPNGHLYSYDYDLMGRKTTLTYPTGGGTETWSYDAAGNVGTFKNRSNNIQTFSYDNRERPSGYDWNDAVTPSQSITYDDASRPTNISAIYPGGPTVNIVNTYYDDDTLQSQEEWSTVEGQHRTVNYTYDADLNRSTLDYPGAGAPTLRNSYTPRNQPWYIDDVSTNPATRIQTYGYDHNENLVQYFDGNIAVYVGGIAYNAMDRMTSITYQFTNGNRTINYGYNERNDRTLMNRDFAPNWTYGYDLNEQATTTNDGEGTFTWDACGNRTGASFVTNALNEQTTIAGKAIGYDARGSISSYSTSPQNTYSYDAMNRLTGVTMISGNTESFVYDGLDRKISQTINGVTTYNVWDGWNLIQEYNAGSTVPNYNYVYGARGLARRTGAYGTIYYFQDALGNTAYTSDGNGNAIECFVYDRFGQVSVYGPGGAVRTAPSWDVRHLFTGQVYMPLIGLYDLRNRVYSPIFMRFMQADPIGFGGDPANLYRYCGNNTLTKIDPLGTDPSSSGGGDTGGSNADSGDTDGDGSRPTVRVIVDGGRIGGYGDHNDPFGINGGNGADPFGMSNAWGIRSFTNWGDAMAYAGGGGLGGTPGGFGEHVHLTIRGVQAFASQRTGYWTRMLVTSFNDPIGSVDNQLGPGSIAVGNTLLSSRSQPIGSHVNYAYPLGTPMTVYFDNGSVYNGTVQDWGRGNLFSRSYLGAPNGVSAADWIDVWMNRDIAEWATVHIGDGSGP